MTKIRMTVALPMYRAQHAGWLALESLCWQRDVDFEWELIVIEEQFDAMGEDAVRAYEGRLQQKGCRDLRYFSLDRWIPLSHKWYYLAHLAVGDYFMLQAADCYSHPRRLQDTYLALHGAEWVQQPLGAFVDIASQHVSIYDQRWFLSNADANHESRTALNMATQTELMRLIPKEHKRRYVDNWIFTNIENAIDRAPIVFENLSDQWRFGMDTHGLNNISHSRRSMLGLRGHDYAPPFRPPQEDEPKTIRDIVPEAIAQKLEWMENDAKMRVNTSNVFLPGHDQGRDSASR